MNITKYFIDSWHGLFPQTPTPIVPLPELLPKEPTTVPINNGDQTKNFSSVVEVAQNVLITPSAAIRTDRALAEMMENDPVITNSLFKRILATAKLEFEVVPEDDNDAYQKFVAKEVETIIGKIPRRVDLFRSLLWGTWRGTGVSELYWIKNEQNNMWEINKHIDHNGDKIFYDRWGSPHIQVITNQSGGRALTQYELDRLIIFTFNPIDGSFYNGAEAAYIYKGKGLRENTFWVWWLSHQSLKYWTRFQEIYSGSIMLGKFPADNAMLKEAITGVLKSLKTNSLIAMPVPADESMREAYGLEILNNNSNANNSQVFMDFIETYCNSKIKIAIEGSSLTSEKGSTGLGSNLASKHQESFADIVEYDSKLLEECLTEQLIEKIVRFNFGKLPFKIRFKFINEIQDVKQDIENIKVAKSLGLPISKAWLYGKLNIPIPQDGEELIGGELSTQDTNDKPAVDNAEQSDSV